MTTPTYVDAEEVIAKFEELARTTVTRAEFDAHVQRASANQAAVLDRVDAVEAAQKPPPLDIKTDLYRRLTSRPLWTAFILPALGAVIAAAAGEISWLQAMVIIAGGGGVFGAIEGGRDIASARKGHQRT